MKELINIATNSQIFKDLDKKIKEKISPISLLGLTDVEKVYITSAIRSQYQKANLYTYI